MRDIRQNFVRYGHGRLCDIVHFGAVHADKNLLPEADGKANRKKRARKKRRIECAQKKRATKWTQVSACVVKRMSSLGICCGGDAIKIDFYEATFGTLSLGHCDWFENRDPNSIGACFFTPCRQKRPGQKKEHTRPTCRGHGSVLWTKKGPIDCLFAS
jgi:hypothetical protein